MRRFAWLLLVVLATPLLATPASAQYFGQNKVQYDDFDFRILETEHFQIYYYPEEEQAARDAGRMVERWYERHTQTFLHRFQEKKPIILYANDADFQQTNVTEGTIGPGTGGFTEPRKERVVMPLTGAYGSTDHVLGHELVHSFQFDIALNQEMGLNLRLVPLWLVEGMAEYLTIGRYDPHTAMWMRDAVLRDDVPTIAEMANPREYFPYRYGQALLAYVAGKYGDQSVTNLYKLAGRVGVDSASGFLYGISSDSLSNEWAQAMNDAYTPLLKDRTPADSAGTRVLARDIDAGNLNVAPTLSPDGRYVAFLSERDLFDITLFVADAETGEVFESLGSVSTTLDLDAIRFISSAGTWDPTGRKLAFVSFANGDNEISVWNVESGDIETSFKVQGVTAIKNPAWSPDGTKIAFSGMEGGISDLYVLNMETDAVRQLTNDRYADLQPTWSPDGSQLAFTTDRGSTELNGLDVSQDMQVATVDVQSREVTVYEPFEEAHHHNPQWSPDGRSLYFISTWDGFKDIYRYALADEALYRVTRLQTGVSGITDMSPAMSIARQNGDMMFSVYSDGTYTGFRLSGADAQGTRIEPPYVPEGIRSVASLDLSLTPPDSAARASASADSMQLAADSSLADAAADTTAADTSRAMPETSDPALTDTPLAGAAAPDSTAPDSTTLARRRRMPPAGTLPPYDVADSESIVASYLSDPGTGLPPSPDFPTDDASSRLTLEGIYPPSVGVSVGGPFGGGVAGGVGFRFSDMLGNQRLDAVVQANGTFRDIGGGVSYLNRGNRFNYGASGSHTPIPYRRQLIRTPQGFSIATQRLYISQVSLNGSYPLNTVRRFETSIGGIRYGFGTNVQGPFEDQIEAQFRDPANQLFAQSSAAYVVDFADFGLTSPVRGARYRFQVSPRVGTQTFLGALVDLRRYLYAKPFTFAVQGVHLGNYGAGEGDIFTDEFLGFSNSQAFVRGYGFRSFEEAADCVDQGEESGSICQGDFARLTGTRVLKTSVEARIPLLGVKPLSLLEFPYLPTEVALFTDAGVAWTHSEPFELTFEQDSVARVPVVSSGVAFRFNVLGSLILEPYWAYAFQRNQPSTFGLLFQPGW